MHEYTDGHMNEETCIRIEGRTHGQTNDKMTECHHDWTDE